MVLMKRAAWSKSPFLLPGVLAAVALAVIVFWLGSGVNKPLVPRLPGADQAPGSELGATNPVLAGKLIGGDGQPAAAAGAWPQFRGPRRDGICETPTRLLHAWQPSEPRELWAVDVGEGYAGAAILNGRVYVMDYDRGKRQDALRCLSLENGHEIWRYVYPVSIKRNHGMSRTNCPSPGRPSSFEGNNPELPRAAERSARFR